MAITDATTSVNTTWVEYPTVSFTAGTLSDISAMVTEVESKLKRGTLSATSSPTSTDVQRWLVRAKEEIMQIKSFTFARRYAYASLTSGEYRVSLPPDYNGGDVRIKDQTNDRSITLWPATLFDTKFPDPDEESSNKPLVGCIKNMELWLVPPVSGTTIIEAEYERSGDDNTSTDMTFLPEIERFRCCDYATYESFESLHDLEKAAWFKGKWGDGLARSSKANAKRKWKEMGFRAVSIFEKEYIRGFQN